MHSRTHTARAVQAVLLSIFLVYCSSDADRVYRDGSAGGAGNAGASGAGARGGSTTNSAGSGGLGGDRGQNASGGQAPDFSEGGAEQSSAGAGGVAMGGALGEAGERAAGGRFVSGAGGDVTGSGGVLTGAGGVAISSGGVVTGSGGVAISSGGVVTGAGGAVAKGGAAAMGGNDANVECRLNVHCTDVARPFCSATFQCVQCLVETDCPAPPGDCWSRSCVLGACQQAPKASTAACGSTTNTTCDAPDSCDGQGHCLSNYKASGVACGSSTNNSCDAPDSCDGQGQCLPNYKAATTSCDDGLFCNGADQCDATGHCTHASSVCGGRVCHEDVKKCECDTTLVVKRYCGAIDEATDREAVRVANEACAGCVTACNGCQNYSRSTVNGCQEFRCVP